MKEKSLFRYESYSFILKRMRKRIEFCHYIIQWINLFGNLKYLKKIIQQFLNKYDILSNVLTISIIRILNTTQEWSFEES